MENNNLYDDDYKLYGWDFEKNIDKDIMEISSLSNETVHWKCPHCNEEYEYEINSHNDESCPVCGFERWGNFLSVNIRRRLFLNDIKSFIIILLMSIIMSVISNCISFELEDLSDTNISLNLILTIIWGIFLITTTIYLVRSILENKLQNNKSMIEKRTILYNIINECPNKKTLFKNYYVTLENRLLFLSNYSKSTLSKENVLKKFKHSKVKDFINSLVVKNNQREFKNILSIYRDKTYFIKIYSCYENKSLIDFNTKINISSIIMSAFVSVLSFSLAIFSDITNWDLFLRKLTALIIALSIAIILTLLSYRYQKRSYISKIQFDTCYISSAIAKTINNK